MLKKWLLISFLLLNATGYALDLELTQGINSALPIGIDTFGLSPEAQELTSIVNHDLALTGQFNIIMPLGSLEHSITQWKSNGADSVLIGSVSTTVNNHLAVHFKLLDAAAHGNILTQGSFQITTKELRALSHHISDLVYEKLTGEKGVFSTRLAYILVQQQKNKLRRYSLEIADADGNNPQSLLVSGESIMSPSWSPDGRKIAYVSFEKKKAQIFIVEVSTGKRQLITSFNGINGAPAWSPDGKELALVLSKDGNPKIYSVNLSTGRLKQLTFGDSIDTEPHYAPDGKSIIFTSGRGGSPQIYSLNFLTNSIARVTYSGRYNARASFTPNQKQIVMMHRDEDRRFSIAVQDLNNGQVLVLTNSDSDESPSVAPNGRFIVYATHYNDLGVLGLTSIDGRTQARLPSRNGDIQEPAWSPFSG